MATQAQTPAPKGYRFALTRDGLTYVFESAEEQAAFVESRLSRADRVDRAFQRLAALDEQILARTGGRGIPEEDIVDAIAAMRDH